MTETSLFIQALKKAPIPRPAFWFMRQAGRYLPEYREVRASAGGFLDLCYHPEKATQVTLQPIERFDMDAAIIFSDILVVPHALGVNLRFAEGEGPVLEPVSTRKALEMLSYAPAVLAPVYEALRQTRSRLPGSKALIGFAGAPWTLACYMVQGKSDKDFQTVRNVALQDPAFFSALMRTLEDAVAEHLIAQAHAGADALQLFDSWAGVLSAEEFTRYVTVPAQRIVARVKQVHPLVPVIGFPRLAGAKYLEYAQHSGVDAISIDHTVPLEWAASTLQPLCTLQGNLDPMLLVCDKKAMLEQAKRIISILGNKPFVFNLGHGILPPTPPENMRALCDFLKEATSEI